ncbi:serine hydrolase domain-containing protein [Pedobacter duraquae]|uniref:CubicO group peptidase (Beta-lactamase class C family) n=1 Tax=Pedobacter duraquae TaxID=425511 RepID=A0A4R6INU8_9SPHI|nr:serine hydrolase [Pedobacter duraquae]TDO23944.1 CubicO group peptidase (beta-lactamase class C family) [Pedobacter duraquae]
MHSILKNLLILLFTVIAFENSKAQTIPSTRSGKIFFTNSAVTVNKIATEDNLQKTILTNKTNLFISVFLAKTLSSSLHDLAPALSLDSLSKIGNYQFSFLVDDHLIYQTNLIPGAPRALQQQTETEWNKPLIDNQNEGAWWSQSAWNRFMFNGGDQALTEGTHIFKLLIRPYIKVPDLKIGNIIAQGQLELLVKRKPDVNVSDIKLSEIKSYPDLTPSEDSFDHNSIKKLKAYIDADVFRHVTSVVALKKGKILLEEYFNGSSRDSLHDVRSVGKSFASTLTGMAIRDGYIKSVEQTLGDFYQVKDFQQYSGAKQRVKLKELMTMSSRFDGDDDDPNSPGNEENMYPTDNWVKFALDLPLDTVKYDHQWHYFTTGVMLLGSTLDQVIPGGLDKYADNKLFKPLNITNYKWQYMPQKAPSTAGGIRMNALDFAKYGQLYANKGRWKGKQILPEAWVNESLSHQIPITEKPGEYYGYLFWNKIYRSGGKIQEAYYCSGNGGNKIYIFKDLDLVVVITATAYGNGYAHRQADQIIEEYILPAIL